MPWVIVDKGNSARSPLGMCTERKRLYGMYFGSLYFSLKMAKRDAQTWPGARIKRVRIVVDAEKAKGEV